MILRFLNFIVNQLEAESIDFYSLKV